MAGMVTGDTRPFRMKRVTVGPDRTHGIRATYVDGCRCQPCRDANTLYARVKANTPKEDRPEQEV